ncbi:hypothetical protein [Dyadobacter fermentans]|uniref:hypothetical protein n=1 Tax=Dyadobacter fermentans TaxID=94254 RepID=UPI0033B15C40
MKTVLFVFLLIPTLSMNAPLDVTWPAGRAARENQEKTSAAYLFPSFVKGMVYFRNGTKREAFLNYHCQDGQMRFLNPRADTLLFTGKYLIDYIEVEDRRFVLTDTHSDMEVIGEGGRARLAARTQPEIAGNSLSHSGQHFSASEGNAGQVQMVTNQGGLVQWQNNASGQRWRMKTSYFLIDQNRVVHATSRRAFLHVYGRNRRQLTRYLRENRVDFGHADDLQRLFGFCSSLASL